MESPLRCRQCAHSRPTDGGARRMADDGRMQRANSPRSQGSLAFQRDFRQSWWTMRLHHAQRYAIFALMFHPIWGDRALRRGSVGLAAVHRGKQMTRRIATVATNQGKNGHQVRVNPLKRVA